MALNRRLSTLEFTALGIISKKQPCTAYAVMVEFAESQSSTFAKSTGTIYPMLRRLTAAGLVTAESADGSTHYRLTDLGSAGLAHWFELSGSEVSCCLDPIRIRSYFLGSVPLEARKGFLESAIPQLESLISDCRDRMEAYRKSGDKFSELAMRGAVMETEARLKWIRGIAAELGAALLAPTPEPG